MIFTNHISLQFLGGQTPPIMANKNGILNTKVKHISFNPVDYPYNRLHDSVRFTEFTGFPVSVGSWLNVSTVEPKRGGVQGELDR